MRYMEMDTIFNFFEILVSYSHRQNLTVSTTRMDCVNYIDYNIRCSIMDTSPPSASSAPSIVVPNSGDGKSQEDLLARIRSLEHQLEVERANCRHLEQDKRVLNQACVNLQQHAEQDEEYISNSLWKRIKDLEKEKLKLEAQGEDTQALHYQLERLRREKVMRLWQNIILKSFDIFLCVLSSLSLRFLSFSFLYIGGA